MLDQIHVVAVEGDALRVAMAERVHGGPARSPGDDRIVTGDAPIPVDPEQLAVEGIGILRERLHPGLAHRHPEVFGPVEADPAAIVVAARAHSVPDHVAVEAPRVAGHLVAEHLVHRGACRGDEAGRAHVDEPVRSERRVDCDTHQPGLAGLAHVVDREGGQLRGGGRAGLEELHGAASLGHEHPAVRHEREIPRCDQSALDDLIGEARDEGGPARTWRHRGPARRRRGTGRRRRRDRGRRACCGRRCARRYPKDGHGKRETVHPTSIRAR